MPSITTLGDILDSDMDLSWHCKAQGCGRMLGLSLVKAIELWGRDTVYVGREDWPIKCSTCGSRRIGMIVEGKSHHPRKREV